ncbi:DUF4156 domain-containing protein [Pragia fontium]|uniref:DUF4156 domain-containing protein n=1 Tax=Pragia fontium DSM 5563 = ATCC 49100 TaxID=1122977 RepID=A0AAJ5BIC7_9GAMM|nr:DUF4156 domain-containing protein [Pragia fontium]SFD29090.1 protein of unknown function [Pragia fontium DSM 5563 = ATCC 49100]VEJ56825.1 Uncharacterised protein [Pragia fontium]
MQNKLFLGLAAATLLLAGCSSSNPLSGAGQQVRLVDDKPGAECQLLGSAEGSQSNWLSGANSEYDSVSSATNELRNKAAAMGGNVLYGVSGQGPSFLSDFVPLDSKVSGQVYRCPN